MKQKILFIPGIFNPRWYQKYWRALCTEHGFEYIELENPYYSYWRIESMEEVIEEWVEKFKEYENEELIVICHSFGGILINCILQRLGNYKIKKLVILASPLQMNILGMRKRKKLLKYNPDLNYDATKIISYGGYIDLIVPCVWTRYKDEEHHTVFGEHFYFLFSKRFIRKILKSLEE